MDIEDDKFMCMICKLSDDLKPLCLMSFIQKSTAIASKYLKVDHGSYFITSCNHTIHLDCYNKIYGNRDYSFCNLCKNSCNLLLIMDKKSNKKEEKL